MSFATQDQQMQIVTSADGGMYALYALIDKYVDILLTNLYLV